MRTIIPTDYHISIDTRMSPKEAITSINQVGIWWAKKAEGNFKKQGDIFTVQFGETFVKFEISEMVPEKKIIWQVLDCHLHWLNDKKEWNGTRLIWTITPKKEGSHIDMIHEGLRPGVECFEDCRKGWDGHIKGSLFRLLNGGKGSPE